MVNAYDYQGWRNPETWNTNLWIGNEYGLYRTVRELYNRSKNEGDFADSLEYYITLVLARFNGYTQDGYRLALVDWCQIAESWYYENKDSK